MCARLRFVLLFVALSVVAYSAAKIIAPASLTDSNMAVGAIFVLIVAFIVARRSDGPDREPAPSDPRSEAAPPGRNYEAHVSETLRSMGWQIVPTRKSRDRGCDVYAMKGRIR